MKVIDGQKTVVFFDATCDSITVSWPETCAAIRYVLQYRRATNSDREEDDCDYETLSDHLTTTQARKKNLIDRDGIGFIFRVGAVVHESEGVKSWITHSEPFHILTRREESERMAALTVDSRGGAHSAVLSWEDASSTQCAAGIRGYELQMRKNDAGEAWETVAPCLTGTEVRKKNLLFRKGYQFRVRPVLASTDTSRNIAFSPPCDLFVAETFRTQSSNGMSCTPRRDTSYSTSNNGKSNGTQTGTSSGKSNDTSNYRSGNPNGNSPQTPARDTSGGKSRRTPTRETSNGTSSRPSSGPSGVGPSSGGTFGGSPSPANRGNTSSYRDILDVFRPLDNGTLLRKEDKGTLFRKAKESTISVKEAFKDKDFILLYASAHWCVSCKKFTPMLVQWYKAQQQQQQQNDDDRRKQQSATSVEVVFLSADHDAKDFRKYYASMPWLAVDYDDGGHEELINQFGVSGIPRLVVLHGRTGRILEENAAVKSLDVDRWQSLAAAH